MTAQEIFEKVVIHLFTQGKKSLRLGMDATCQYRGPNGDMCAAGVLIRDEDYNPKWDSSGGIAYESYMTPHIDEKHQHLISDLQSLHDGHSATNSGKIYDGGKQWDSTSEMQKSVIWIASKHELDAGFVQGLSFKDR